MKNSELNPEQIEALVNTLGGIDYVLASLRGEVKFVPYDRQSKNEDGHWGLPAGKDELEDGAVYTVENFCFCSWGYLAQLKKVETQARLVSRQYRVTTIQHMVQGTNYRCDIKEDKNSVLDVRAFFTPLPH